MPEARPDKYEARAVGDKCFLCKFCSFLLVFVWVYLLCFLECSKCPSLCVVHTSLSGGYTEFHSTLEPRRLCKRACILP